MNEEINYYFSALNGADSLEDEERIIKEFHSSFKRWEDKITTQQSIHELYWALTQDKTTIKDRIAELEDDLNEMNQENTNE